MYEVPPSFEKKPEHIPTLEEIKWVLEELMKGENYSEVRCLKDSEGIYLFEVKTRDKLTGEILVHSYTRKGHRENFPKSSETGVDIVYYKDEDAYKKEDVEYAEVLAKYVDENWELQANGNWEDL
ncbi:MAG: hypothetical protein PHX30_00760 [Candidatus Pacebacteria bacterium]|nr:hypothetical protein [Candidatus Paceibacterota bacterium]